MVGPSSQNLQPYGTFVEDEETGGGEASMTQSSFSSSGADSRNSPGDREKGSPKNLSMEEDERLTLMRPRSANSGPAPQTGVQRVEAIASTWTPVGLWIAYLGILLTTWATSLEAQTTNNLTIYATSDFKSHAMIATVMVVQSVVLSVVKPPMSKVADVFGRFEAFCLCIFLYVIGYIQQAASRNVEMYAAAQIFYSAGQTGLQILFQIFIADTTDLPNRALIVTVPDLPFLVNVWLGPLLAKLILRDLNWRWGYGMWAIILPVAFMPMALVLCMNQRKAARKGLLPLSPLAGQDWSTVLRTLWFELDVLGLLLICVGFSLLLIPLTIIAKTGWSHPGVWAMLLSGLACLIAFPFWEKSPRFAPRAFFPPRLFRNRTVLAGLVFAFFYFMAFYLSVYPYFQSYLIVVRGLPVDQAGRIVQIFTFSATVTSILVSLFIKYNKRYRVFVTLGAALYVLGLVGMLFLRTADASLASTIAAQVLLGVGGGMCHGPAQLGIQASASHRDVAAATAAFLASLEIGGAVGSAISGAIWSANVPVKLARYLPPETRDQAKLIFDDVKLAANGWPMGSSTRTAINRAYQETMTRILMVSVLAAIPCVLLSFAMKDYKLDEIERQVKGVVIGQQSSTLHADERSLSSPTSRLLGDSEDDENEGSHEDYEDGFDITDDDEIAGTPSNPQRTHFKKKRSQSIKLQPSRTTLRSENNARS